MKVLLDTCVLSELRHPKGHSGVRRAVMTRHEEELFLSVISIGEILKGMPEWQADGLVEDFDLYRRGEAAKMTTTVRDVTGIAPIAFSQFARDYADAFRGKAVGAS